MPLTFKDIRTMNPRHGPRLVAFDCLRLDNAKDVAKLFTYLSHYNAHWLLWAELLQHSLNLTDIDSPLKAGFYHASNNSSRLLAYLGQCSELELKQLAAETGHLASSYLIGGLAAVEFMIAGANEQTVFELFVWACSSNLLPLVERLLNSVEPSCEDNKALFSAAFSGQRAIVNRLLEFKLVRQADLSWAEDKALSVVTDGLKRALWLDLQNVAGFDQIATFDELRMSAQTSLNRAAPWMNKNCPLPLNSLIESLRIQILSWHSYHNPQRHHQIRQLSVRVYKLDLNMACQVASYLLPKHLQHLVEQKRISRVVIRCLNQWLSKGIGPAPSPSVIWLSNTQDLPKANFKKKT